MPESLTRILYVEDETDIQLVARLALEVLGGYKVQMCSSGSEALAVAAEFNPQLIALDVMMPGMSGPDTLIKLRAMPQFALTPVIFITARVQPGEVSAYLQSGAADVIAKPFDPMTLSAKVQTIWENSHV